MCVAERETGLEPATSDINHLVRGEPLPLFAANGSKLLAFFLTAARDDAIPQRADAIRAARWRIARDVDRRVAGARQDRPHIDRETREMDRLASDAAEESLRAGTGPIGLFDLHDHASEGDVACWTGWPLPPFQVRALPVQPLSASDQRSATAGSGRREAAHCASRTSPERLTRGDATHPMPRSGMTNFWLALLDSTCFGELTDAVKLERFLGSLRAAAWIAQPSELNLIEVSCHENEHKRRALLNSIRVVKGNQPLLGWPIRLLKEATEAALTGPGEYVVPASGKEWYLFDERAVTERVADAREFAARIENAYDWLHDRGRARVQKYLRERKARATTASATEFLRDDWPTSESRYEFADATWQSLKLPGEVRMDVIKNSQAWQLYLDAEGVVLYERAVAHEMPRRAHRLDVLQLLCLAFSSKRMLISKDLALLRVAGTVLHGRYLNARAVSLTSIIG